MAKDEAPRGKLAELSDAEIERIEAAVFCCGGPPEALPRQLVNRACGERIVKDRPAGA